MVRALMRGEARAGFCATRPSGHHATQDYAMGFCLLSSFAIAAELAIRELGVERVLILDWDVHHGNGTADIFRRRSDVLFASIQQLGLFPGTGAVSDLGSAEGRGYTINVPVPQGADEEMWLSALEYVIVPAAVEFAPQLVLHPPPASTHIAMTRSVIACSRRARSHRWPATCGTWLRRSTRPSGPCSKAATTSPALTESVMATITALAGVGTAESIAPDPFLTSRVAAHVGHYWTL